MLSVDSLHIYIWGAYPVFAKMPPRTRILLPSVSSMCGPLFFILPRNSWSVLFATYFLGSLLLLVSCSGASTYDVPRKNF